MRFLCYNESIKIKKLEKVLRIKEVQRKKFVSLTCIGEKPKKQSKKFQRSEKIHPKMGKTKIKTNRFYEFSKNGSRSATVF